MTCGDTEGAWVGSTAVWQGTLDPGTPSAKAFTATFLPVLLGSRIASTVIALESGAGVWVLDNTFHWTASLVNVWDYTFEAVALTCNGAGKVLTAEGGATDALSVVHPFTMSRTV